MTASVPQVVITHEHQAVGDAPDYHEWVYMNPIKCDRRGRPNPRMYSADWQFWRCNNVDCPAEAVVSNDAIRSLIEAAS